METKRMPKGWIFIGTNDLAFGNKRTKAEQYREINRFNRAIAAMPKLDADKYKKKCDEDYEIIKAEQDNLLQAYTDKKLKSKALIKQAKQIQKERAKAKK